jgi:hypothetical protein
MFLMGIQGWQQAGPFSHHTHPDVFVTMNPPFVALGQTEAAFQLQVVPRHILPHGDTHKQTHHPTGHRLAQLLPRGHWASRKLLLEADKPLTASGPTTVRRVERCSYLTHVRQLLLHLATSLFHLRETRVDALDQIA